MRGSTRVPPTSRGAPFPFPSSRGGILSLRGRERIPGVLVASQEEELSTGKARGTPGSCHIPRVPQMSQSIPGKPVFHALLRLSSRGSLPFAWIKGSVAFPRGFPTRLSHEAFLRGFPTRLSHRLSLVPPGCESILGLKVEAVQGKHVSLEWTDIWGALGMVARPRSSSCLSG